MSTTWRKATIGLVTPPAWFEPAVQNFPTLVRESIGVQQMPVPIAEFSHQIGAFADAEAYVGEAARILAYCDCQVIGQIGTLFGFDGCATEAAARARAERFGATAGVPVITTALAVVDALRAVGATRVAVAATYYSQRVRDLWSAFLNACGIAVQFSANLADLGLTAGPGDYLWEFRYDMTEEVLATAIKACASAAPNADAVVVAGTASTTFAIAARLEKEIGRPVIGSDAAISWALIAHCGLTPSSDYGALFRNPAV